MEFWEDSKHTLVADWCGYSKTSGYPTGSRDSLTFRALSQVVLLIGVAEGWLSQFIFVQV
jgi:hypothetical protein